MPSCYTKKKGYDRKGNQRYKPDLNKYLYNIDTLWLNADSINYDDVMESGFLDLLMNGRNYYMDTGELQSLEVVLPNYSEPLNFDVYPGQAPQYQYSIRNEDLAVYFARKKRDDSSFPMKIQINQFILWEKGIHNAFQEALYVLSSFGFVVDSTKLNRVDFAVHSDQFKWTLEDLKTFDYPRNISDDNKPNFFKLDPLNGEFESVYYGDRTNCLLRIYNKSLESYKKKKYYFIDMYLEKGMDVSNVWNVEIEVRRKFIKECKDYQGRNLFDDFELVLKENRLADLWSYLMSRYFHDSAHWKVISQGSPYKSFYKVDGYELVRQKDIDSSFEREVAQIAGRLKLAVLGEEDYSLEHAIEIFKEKYKEIEVDLKEKDWNKEVEKKKKSLHNILINSTINEVLSKKKKKESSCHEDSQSYEI